MEKGEKEFAGAIFDRCGDLRILADKYYREKINESEFLREFARIVFLIAESFMIKKGMRI